LLWLTASRAHHDFDHGSPPRPLGKRSAKPLSSHGGKPNPCLCGRPHVWPCLSLPAIVRQRPLADLPGLLKPWAGSAFSAQSRFIRSRVFCSSARTSACGCHARTAELGGSCSHGEAGLEILGEARSVFMNTRERSHSAVFSIADEQFSWAFPVELAVVAPELVSCCSRRTGVWPVPERLGFERTPWKRLAVVQ